MATSRAKKEKIYNHLETFVKAQKTVLFLTTNQAKESLNAEQNTKLRKQAKQLGVSIKVIKNTITKKLFTDFQNISGQTYIVYADDDGGMEELQVAQTVLKIRKEDFKDNFQILGSYVNQEFYDSVSTEKLLDIPTKKDSMATIAGLLNSMNAKNAILIKEIATKLARSIQQVSDQKA